MLCHPPFALSFSLSDRIRTGHAIADAQPMFGATRLVVRTVPIKLAPYDEGWCFSNGSSHALQPLLQLHVLRRVQELRIRDAEAGDVGESCALLRHLRCRELAYGLHGAEECGDVGAGQADGVDHGAVGQIGAVDAVGVDVHEAQAGNTSQPGEFGQSSSGSTQPLLLLA
jgi:hypothetical protein